MTTYVEYAASDGPGTLVAHGIVGLAELPSPIYMPDVGPWNYIISQTLTEQEAQAFYTMHGDSWVAV